MKALNKLMRRRQGRKGQGMTEYIIIVGLIAILLVFAVQKFKNALQGAFDKGATAIDTEITQKIPGG